MAFTALPKQSAHTLSEAFDHFLARSRFSARTRESYLHDLAPLLGRVGTGPVSSLDRTEAAAYLSTSEGLAAGTYNRRYAALPPQGGPHRGEGYARLSYRQADTLWKGYAPGWDLHQSRHTEISTRAAQGYTEVELKRFSGHMSLRSLEVYIAHNREAAKRKEREWERRHGGGS